MSSNRVPTIAILLATASLLLIAPAAAMAEKPYVPPKDQAVYEKLQHWQDLKFGLFMHWGIYSVWGITESWPICDATPYGRNSSPMWEKSGKDPDKFMQMYFDLNTQFDPEDFDPAPWAQAAWDAGMRYVMFTTKHHDGFCMFDTHETDYRITHADSPFHDNPRANVAKEIFNTFRDKGFMIGAYYSRTDWHHPDYWEPRYLRRDRMPNYNIQEQPYKWDRFVRFVHDQIAELTGGEYGPVDILWLDGASRDLRTAEIARIARANQPGLLMVDRGAKTLYENYRTPEQEVPDEALPYPWETCMTMARQWSWNENDRYKPTRQLIHTLVDIVAKGGCLLLNVGPSPKGDFHPTAYQRLREIGQWMKVNDQAIYGTRAVAPYKVGQICLTKRCDKTYLIYLPAEGVETPPAQMTMPGVCEVASLRMLGVDQPLEWNVDSGTLTVQIPESVRQSPPCQYAWSIELTDARLCDNVFTGKAP